MYNDNETMESLGDWLSEEAHGSYVGKVRNKHTNEVSDLYKAKGIWIREVYQVLIGDYVIRRYNCELEIVRQELFDANFEIVERKEESKEVK